MHDDSILFMARHFIDTQKARQERNLITASGNARSMSAILFSLYSFYVERLSRKIGKVPLTFALVNIANKV